MTSRHEVAADHLRRGDFSAALAAFRAICDAHPDDWYAWYGAGQSARFLDDYTAAVRYLQRSARLDPTRSSTLLALGIALQLDGNLAAAADQLGAAIALDPDLAPAFNSLAITQKRMNQLDKALHNLDAGRKAVARRLVKRMQNDRRNAIIKLRDPVGTKWVECASFGALWLASDAGAESISWPTGEMAEKEERTEDHGGLYFTDHSVGRGFVRAFLPNYFASFHRWLSEDGLFANLVGNEGSVWQLLGKKDTAEECFQEARAFGDPSRRSVTWTTG